MIPNIDHYWLKNAHIPACLLEDCEIPPQTRDDLSLVDLEIQQGEIVQILPAGEHETRYTPVINLQRRIIFPCFVDLHTHLDKGHIWERSPNPNATFEKALEISKADAKKYWTSEDVYRRMEFGIECSYVHGTKAIRTHLDCYGEQADVTLEVFAILQAEWRTRVILQPVSLVSLDYYTTPQGVALADKFAAIEGVLGGVVYANPELESQLDAVFSLAKERGLNLDFHVDENDDPTSNCLGAIAHTAIRHQFTGQIVCGHCCSLALQQEEEIVNTLNTVKQANIGIVSLPLCNLYLQDRHPGRTPRWRGVTCVHEIQQQEIPVTFASDNCRDPFHAYGDHDVLDVLKESVRTAHLDTHFIDYPATVTKTAADLMGLPNVGRLRKGLPADFIIFKARYFSELLARSQRDRIVVRKGKQMNTTLPDYAELDDLMSR